jgi:hypothetical protein
MAILIKHQRLKIPATSIVTGAIACLVLLTSCGGGGGGGGGGSINNVPTTNTPVAQAQSPIPGMEGVKIELEGGVSLFALKPVSDQSRSNPQVTLNRELDAKSDKKNLVGEGLFSFNGVAIQVDRAVVAGVDVTYVIECTRETRSCEDIGLKRDNDVISFKIKAGKYYAIQK